MGVDKNTYIGCYIKIKRPSLEKSTYYNSCINTSCSEYDKEIKNGNSDSFCTFCGHKIGDRSKKFIHSLSSYDLESQCNIDSDSFYDISHSMDVKNFILWIPNLTMYSPVNVTGEKYDRDEIRLWDVHPEAIELDLHHFKFMCEDILKKLETVIPKEDISIHWGILTYWS